MAEEFEDPIEAIKRRNEERARRLKERIASGEFDKYETPLEEVDETLTVGPEVMEAPESEFDLSSFPAPPEPTAIPFGEEGGAAVAEPPGAPPAAPPEMPAESPPETPPEFGPPPEPGVMVEEPELTPAPAESASEEVLAGLELTELDLEGVGEVLAPQPWDGAEAPAVAAAPEVPPGLEIEVEPVAAAPPEPEPVAAAPPAEEEVAFAPEIGPGEEPSLREEEAEAIKATIEDELREVPPAAPPLLREEEVPAAPSPEPVPVPEAAPAAPAVAEISEAEVFIGIEVLGNKVRIERRNITLAGAVELFKSIIDRYQNR